MNTIRAAITCISHSLDGLIRLLFDRYAKSKPIVDISHLLRLLEEYARNCHLKSTTLFYTSDNNNLYIMLPQDESLNILEEFLSQPNIEEKKRITRRLLKKQWDLHLL
ncbi:unnamed protein product [Rotaria sordida]|uniref:Uncharacterized protein n=1 Tax=Rotaria sordida TaxID=392033 RepID=A0A816AA81_9BILA|nr:unnamed protein product [Rotaria sordida]CAF1334040.1 unnamed protein product [Rotaria sordida]CAF1593310.1 unnamed protein product [Rotaria sordida]CAF1593327.1 unnamed protein product [Rotaria sordida]